MEITEVTRECDICGCDKNTLISKKPSWTKTSVIKYKNKLYHSTDVMCNNCGVIYKNPMMSRESMRDFYQDAYMQLYEPFNVTSISGVSIALRAVTAIYCLDWLDSIGYDITEKKVFEIGCGFGTLLMAMRSLGAEVAGVEPGKRSSEIGEKVFGFKATVNSFEEFNISHLYDLVIINNTLEHFYSPTEALKKAKTMLLPHGKILVEVPSMLYPYPGIPIDGFLSSAHNFTFSKESFEWLAYKCGLKIDYMAYKGHKKCMFFLLSEYKHSETVQLTIPPTKENINKLLNQYQEVNTFIDDISDQVKFTQKMKEEGYLGIAKEYPNHTNVLGISYVNWLLAQNKPKESLDFLNSPAGVWKDNQSEDVDMHPGTLTYLRGLTYRHLGDFLQAKKCFEEAMLQYPHFYKYNFLSDMVINGLIPENIFGTSSWYNCAKTLEMM